MFGKLLVCKLIGKNPIVELKSQEFTTETFVEASLLSTLIENLFRVKVYKQLFDIIECTLGSKKLSGRNIEKSNATHWLTKMYRCKEVILFIIKNIIIY
jgi:hypothetical protein